ncbi:hypothetical protein T484DRAFT_1893874 [Baffinella frigidus]|nr:hypothetical protein T484DRAFT_1893874 [Cryptophyta sp. CCMP2293]
MQPSHGFLALAAALLCVLSAPVCAATGAEEPTCKSDGCGAHVLTYFPSVRVIPGGRGEAVRIALHAAGIKHEDKHMIYSEYTELKAKTDDWVWKNGLPILSVDGKEFTQSVAALRYAGKKAGLYPADALAALAVDEILDITQDILTKTPMGEDQAKKMAGSFSAVDRGQRDDCRGPRLEVHAHGHGPRRGLRRRAHHLLRRVPRSGADGERCYGAPARGRVVRLQVILFAGRCECLGSGVCVSIKVA